MPRRGEERGAPNNPRTIEVSQDGEARQTQAHRGCERLTDAVGVLSRRERLSQPKVRSTIQRHCTT